MSYCSTLIEQQPNDPHRSVDVGIDVGDRVAVDEALADLCGGVCQIGRGRAKRQLSPLAGLSAGCRASFRPAFRTSVDVRSAGVDTQTDGASSASNAGVSAP